MAKAKSESTLVITANLKVGQASRLPSARAGAERGRVAELFPHDFELDAGMHRDLVAADAELGFVQRGKRVDALVNVLAAFLRRGADLVITRVGQHRIQTCARIRAAHRVKNFPRHHAPFAVHAAVFFIDAMAGDAGDAFARNFGAFLERKFAALAEGRADGRVAGNANKTSRRCLARGR